MAISGMGVLVEQRERGLARRRSLWLDAARRLLRNRLAAMALVILVLLTFLTIVGPP